jgi:hypothetical protein
VDAMCEAKRERCARVATQSLTLLTEGPRRRVLKSYFPQTIGVFHERLLKCLREGDAVE